MAVSLDQVVQLARSQLGVPYIAFTERPGQSFDCSGLTQWVYAQMGVHITHQSNIQYEELQKIPYAQAQPGDLVFFRGANPHPPEMIGHVGIYVGNGMMIDAPGTGKKVELVPVYHSHFAMVGRPAAFNGGTFNGSVQPLPTSSGTGFTGGTMGSSLPGMAGPTQIVGAGSALAPQPPGDPAALYPQYSPFLKDPELGPILTAAAAVNLSTPQLEAKLQATNWWKTHSDAMRQWDALVATDPATVSARRAAQLADIQKLAGSLGVTIPGSALSSIVDSSLRQGWTSQEIQNALGAVAAAQPAALNTKTADDLRKTAAAYGMPITEDQINGWVTGLLNGSKSLEQFTAGAQTAAKSRFPSLSKMLDEGQTLADIAQPYLQAASDILGVPTDQMNLTDSKWTAGLAVAQKDGTKIPMNLPDWQTYVRRTPTYDWSATADARSATYSFLHQLGTMFGKEAA